LNKSTLFYFLDKIPGVMLEARRSRGFHAFPGRMADDHWGKPFVPGLAASFLPRIS